jgi:beta-fructofuranosidase
MRDGDRRVLWGWVIETRSEKAYSAAGWAGSMSLPRVLTYENGYMRIEPAEEIKLLRNESIVKKGFVVPGDGSQVRIDHSNQSELRFVFDPRTLGKNSAVGCRVLSGPDEWTSIFYDAEKEVIIIDRNHSSLSSEDVHSAIEIPVWSRKTGDPSVDDVVDVDVFIDHSILEVFVNSRAVGTARVYPTESDSVFVSMWAQLGATSSRSTSDFQFQEIEMHTLDGIWLS